MQLSKTVFRCLHIGGFKPLQKRALNFSGQHKCANMVSLCSKAPYHLEEPCQQIKQRRDFLLKIESAL